MHLELGSAISLEEGPYTVGLPGLAVAYLLTVQKVP